MRGVGRQHDAGERGHVLGRRGEALAASELRRRGWRILARNFRLGHKEIDLVVRRGEVVAFVEVKTRAGLGYGHPLAAITRAKRQEIERVARAWVARHGRPGDMYRFDAVAVLLLPGGSCVIEHCEDAWRL
ncbi:MAG: YraN family protein [Gemmatimonadetes bacterium]|nr:YraN family protein [Gemmatimonadota bacterium]